MICFADNVVWLPARADRQLTFSMVLCDRSPFVHNEDQSNKHEIRTRYDKFKLTIVCRKLCASLQLHLAFRLHCPCHAWHALTDQSDFQSFIIEPSSVTL